MPAVTVAALQALGASLRPDTPVVVAGQGRVVLVTRAALDTGAPRALVLYGEDDAPAAAVVDPAVEPPLPFDETAEVLS